MAEIRIKQDEWQTLLRGVKAANYLNETKAAELLGVSVKTIRNWVGRGDIPPEAFTVGISRIKFYDREFLIGLNKPKKIKLWPPEFLTKQDKKLTAMKNNIHIEKYYTGKKAFTLKCVLNGEEKTITVDRADFEEYVNFYDLREHSEVYPGFDGEPVENSGCMSWEEYYDDSRMEDDLKEYVDACLVAKEKKSVLSTF